MQCIHHTGRQTTTNTIQEHTPYAYNRLHRLDKFIYECFGLPMHTLTLTRARLQSYARSRTYSVHTYTWQRRRQQQQRSSKSTSCNAIIGLQCDFSVYWLVVTQRYTTQSLPQVFLCFLFLPAFVPIQSFVCASQYDYFV